MAMPDEREAFVSAIIELSKELETLAIRIKNGVLIDVTAKRTPVLLQVAIEFNLEKMAKEIQLEHDLNNNERALELYKKFLVLQTTYRTISGVRYHAGN